MYKSKILVLLIVVIFVLFVVSQFFGFETVSNYSRAIILPLFALLYFVTIKKKMLFFSLFFVFYAISDVLELLESVMSFHAYYYTGNLLYVVAYVFLFLEICKSISLSYILKNYKIHLMVLTALNIYIVYVLQVIINPYLEQTNQFCLEFFYNVIMLLLLSGALLNYFYKDNKKSLYLFVGSLCIVFSEVINVAYLYITETKTLNFISYSLAVLAFYFYYQQSKLKNQEASRIVSR